MTRPRTIQIFLPDGDPSGIRIAELTTSIIRVIEVPRSEVSNFLSMPEAKQVGLYFLIADDEKEQLYIGQSGEVGARLMQHHRDENKDWVRALVLVSLTNSLTHTHVLYLESLAIEKARDCARYELANGNSGQKPHTPTPLKADCEEIHELGSLLLATLGYPIFESVTKATTSQEEELFYCNRAGVKATAMFTSQGMVVLKGSQAPLDTQVQIDMRLAERRQQLIENGILEQRGDLLIFTQDYLFKSPSGATGVLLQGASNGWVDWRTSSGKTLREYQEEFLG